MRKLLLTKTILHQLLPALQLLLQQVRQIIITLRACARGKVISCVVVVVVVVSTKITISRDGGV